MIRVAEGASLVTRAARCVALAVACCLSDTECAGHLVTDGLLLFPSFLGGPFASLLFFPEPFFFGLFLPAFLLFLLFLFLLLLFLLVQRDAFFQILCNQVLFRNHGSRLGGWLGSGRRHLLWRFRTLVPGFESARGGVDITEIDQDTTIFFRYLSL